jgi:hypothetical protein
MRYLFIFSVSVCSLFFSFNKLFAQAPTISSFSPSTGSIGTLVTITGTNLNNINTIQIGGVSAIKISSTITNLVAMVMPNTVNGSIAISNNYGTSTSNGIFLIVNSNSYFAQQGNKLVDSSSNGFVNRLGHSVAISADGNTAIVGGWDIGSALIYIRNGNIWTQQGNKLVGTGVIGNWHQGSSVAISADGNTAVVGSFGDSSIYGSIYGASWVFVRNGNIWTQQGSKLIGDGIIGNDPRPAQGQSVAMSADGNTLAIGGHNYQNGAVWIFTRTGNIWTQQGNKLVGTDFAGFLTQQGYSVALSADGNTCIFGGINDNGGIGATWIFTRTGNTWTQQGNKLVGTGWVGNYSRQGYSVALSADGNTAIVGGVADSTSRGTSWIFTRNGNIWTQQGNKLIVTGATGLLASWGISVSISADGNTAIVGGSSDNTQIGATWCFKRSGNVWTQKGNKLVGAGGVGSSIYQGSSVAISADGNTFIIGGPADSYPKGAAWVFNNNFISTIGTLQKFEKCLGFNSNAQSISISGVNILSNVTIAASSGFEISRNPITNYSSSILITPVSGVIDTTIIYIRLTKLASGNISGNIFCSNNESTINITVIGTSIVKTRAFIKDFKTIQCLKNNVFIDSSIYCGSITRQWFINNSLISNDSSFQYSFTNAGVYSLKLLVSDLNGEKDSVTKTITVYPSPILTIVASQTSICQGQSVKLTAIGALNYTWTNGVVNDVFFVPDATKNYRVVGSDINGCFDTANITIAVNPMPIVITTLDKNKITTYQFGASFQWYNCDTKLPIASATNQIYNATKNGNYAVIVNLNNCIDTSDCVSVLSVGQGEINHESDFNIYPNPNNGSFTIKLSNIPSSENKITILDMLGRIVYQSEIIIKQNPDNIIIPQLNLVNGLYTLVLNSNGETRFRKSLIIQNTN